MQTNPSSKQTEQESLAEFTAGLLLSLTQQEQELAKAKQEQDPDLFSQRVGKNINRIEIPNLAAQSSL